MDEMDGYRELIKENIDYDLLLTEHPYDEETLEGYVELMVEVCCSRRDFIRIAGEEVATGVSVCGRLRPITSLLMGMSSFAKE